MNCSACGAANPPGMRYCGMCGRSFATTVERERRRASVVFVDLTGFSGLTHDLDPEDLRDLADDVLTSVAAVIEDYDGYIDAFRGDGLIAVFGAPHSHPDDPYRAAVAAEAGLQAIERVGRERGVDLRGRAGVATGVVIAGSVGSGRVREYTVMGSTVNLASRLENTAGPGEVWVGPETYSATRHRLTYETVEGVVLHGFPNLTTAYRLVAGRAREVDPFAHLPFVGRQRELAQLSAWHATLGRRRRRPRVVWVLGEAGSGKSRLLHEFALRIQPAGEGGPGEDRPGAAGANDPNAPVAFPRVVWLRGDPQDGPGWNALARQLFGLSDADDERRRAERVRQALQALIPDEPRWQQLILASLSLAPEPAWRRLERRAVDRKVLAWRDVFAAVAERDADRGPLTVLVESDRLDPDLARFVDQLADTDAPLLLVMASRGHGLPAGATALTLEPLSPEESMRLFLEVADPTFERAGRALIGQVGGVPASVFELGLALAITQDTHFRGSLTSLLQSRLDLLEPRARRILALAAVCGERSWEGLLRAVLGDVRADLRSLRDEDVLVRQPLSALPGETEYRFRSELLRHAVLEMTPNADRRDLHLHVASWLEQQAPLAFSDVIAEHFERGGADDAAYAHYLAAAAEAEAAADVGSAERLLQRIAALDLPPDLRVQGALVYAQTAITRGDTELAGSQLDLAEATLARCEVDTCVQLRATVARLRDDLDHLAQRQRGAGSASARERATAVGPSPTGD